MLDFEQVLQQYNPMISATMRKLNIYKDHGYFKQVAIVALWQAWQRYDQKQGHFAPFAAKSIRGAMLDSLKKENFNSNHIVYVADEVLEFHAQEMIVHGEQWSEEMENALRQLTEKELQFVQWFYVEKRSQVECASLAGVTVGGIKKRRERMLMKLRDALTHHKG